MGRILGKVLTSSISPGLLLRPRRSLLTHSTGLDLVTQCTAISLSLLGGYEPTKYLNSLARTEATTFFYVSAQRIDSLPPQLSFVSLLRSEARDRTWYKVLTAVAMDVICLVLYSSLPILSCQPVRTYIHYTRALIDRVFRIRDVTE